MMTAPQIRPHVPVFACTLCGDTTIAFIGHELFGCETLVMMCAKHGRHWFARSEQVAADPRAAEARTT